MCENTLVLGRAIEMHGRTSRPACCLYKEAQLGAGLAGTQDYHLLPVRHILCIPQLGISPQLSITQCFFSFFLLLIGTLLIVREPTL